MASGNRSGKKSRPPGSTSRPARSPAREVFLLGQPLFRLAEFAREARWQAVISEAEPRDERRKEGFTPAFRPPTEGGEDKDPRAWRRLNRGKLVAGLSDPPPHWRRVALVCGAGLGKTTNLRWLEAALNRQGGHRASQLAFFVEARHLNESAVDLLQTLLMRVQNRMPGGGASLDRSLERELIRKRNQGQITLLLDSLDQAGAATSGPTLSALRQLLASSWKACPIWISGRPYAFAANRDLFQNDPTNRWQFVRVGQLDEPECRYLLEATRATARRRRS